MRLVPLWCTLQACLVYHSEMSSGGSDPDSAEYNQMPFEPRKWNLLLLTGFTVYRVISPLAPEIFFKLSFESTNATDLYHGIDMKCDTYCFIL